VSSFTIEIARDRSGTERKRLCIRRATGIADLTAASLLKEPLRVYSSACPDGPNEFLVSGSSTLRFSSQNRPRHTWSPPPPHPRPSSETQSSRQGVERVPPPLSFSDLSCSCCDRYLRWSLRPTASHVRCTTWSILERHEFVAFYRRASLNVIVRPDADSPELAPRLAH